MWSITSGAGGSWTSGNYTSDNMGNWAVTATYNGLQNFSNLTVYYQADLNQDGKVNFADLQYFVHYYVIHYQTGFLNPRCDLNHDGVLNFEDLQLFVQYYLAYYNQRS